MFQKRPLVASGKSLRGARQRGRDVARGFLTSVDGRGLPIGIFFEELEEPRIAWESFPFRPLCSLGHLLSGFDGFPFGRGDDADEISFYNDTRVRETSLVQIADGDELRT